MDDSTIDSADAWLIIDNIVNSNGYNGYFDSPSEEDCKQLADVTEKSNTTFEIEAYDGDDGYYVSLIGKNICYMTSFDAVISYNANELSFVSTDVADAFENEMVSGVLGLAYNNINLGVYKMSGAFLGEGVKDEEVVIATLKFKSAEDFDASDITISAKLYMNTDYVLVSDTCTVVKSESGSTDVPANPSQPDVHTHSFTNEIVALPGCVSVGEQQFVCGCGEIYTVNIPATGHVDDDADGICDTCSDKLGADDSNDTDNGFLAQIMNMLQKIMNFFMKLFSFI